MRAVIDSNSLLALVRYYLPFDKDNTLKKFIKEKIDSHELIILDKIYEESKYIAKGLVLKELEFLKDKTTHIKTNEILPDNKFFNQLENQFCYGVQKNRLNTIEFETEKNKFLESADAKLILYCIKDNNSLILDKPILVTEETKSENDNKLFKKIPEICTILEIEQCNLPSLFRDHFKINIGKHFK